MAPPLLVSLFSLSFALLLRCNNSVATSKFCSAFPKLFLVLDIFVLPSCLFVTKLFASLSSVELASEESNHGMYVVRRTGN